jgi:hypothetical protein
MMNTRRNPKKISIFVQFKDEIVFLIKYYIFVLWQFFFTVKKRVALKLPIQIYIEDKHSNFMDKWAKLNDANSNIESCVYDNKQLESILSDKGNSLEQKWNSRILYESTPNGNIAMHYNMFKQCFNYYADNKSMTYHVLNAVAMKYCYVYRCRDFFIDEYVLEKPSPLVNMYKVEPNRKKGELVAGENEYGVGRIGKSKLLKPMNTNLKKKIDRMEKEQKETNRFVYCGKMCDFDPFKYIKHKHDIKHVSYMENKTNNEDSDDSMVFVEKEEGTGMPSTKTMRDFLLRRNTDNDDHEIQQNRHDNQHDEEEKKKMDEEEKKRMDEKNRLKYLMEKLSITDTDDDDDDDTQDSQEEEDEEVDSSDDCIGNTALSDHDICMDNYSVD